MNITRSTICRLTLYYKRPKRTSGKKRPTKSDFFLLQDGNTNVSPIFVNI